MSTERSAKLAARRAAKNNGHSLDRWQIEAGQPTAVCACGGYAFITRDGRDFVYGTGRLPVPNSRRIDQACNRVGAPGYVVEEANA